MSTLLVDLIREKNYVCAREVLSHLIEHPNVVNAVDEQGFTALHYAAIRNNTDIAFRLLNAGADVNVKSDIAKRTPLHMAVLGKSDVIVKRLLKHGADMNAADAFGNTPLHFAKSLHQKLAELALSYAGAVEFLKAA